VRSHARKHAQEGGQYSRTRRLGKRLPIELPKYVHKFRATNRPTTLAARLGQLDTVVGAADHISVHSVKGELKAPEESSRAKRLSPVVTAFSRYFDPFRCLPVEADHETDALLYLCEFYAS
jgi:hypothetical protein